MMLAALLTKITPICLFLNSVKRDELVKSQKLGDKVKRLQMQGVQILRNEAYLGVHRND